MALNSFGFLLFFLPLVVIGTHVLRDRLSVRAAQIWILCASAVFYASDRPANVALLAGSILFTWAVSRRMGTSTDALRRKRLFVLGLVGNLLVLCTFKYAGPVSVELGHLTRHAIPAPAWGFPLGVSFFSLTQVMYLVDGYERLVPASSLLDHATFIGFFPNITAGPLIRAKRFIPQLADLAGVDNRDARIARGIALLVMGLFKKVVFGDSFARLANGGYAHVSALSTLGAWATSLAFTFEMYFDFSGYSDMAFGAARLLGVTLVRNFNAPYRAVTISEFWQRWHISLSSFITTYLYTPVLRLMGRPTIHKSAVATLVAMALTGLWHGAAWTFVLFYVIHGVGLAGYQYWKRQQHPLPRPVAALVTFAFVNVAFIMFRSPDLGTAAEVTRRLWPHTLPESTSALPFASALAGPAALFVGLPVAVGCALAFVGPTSDDLAERFALSPSAAMAIAGAMVVAFLFMSAGHASAFLYRAF